LPRPGYAVLAAALGASPEEVNEIGTAFVGNFIGNFIEFSRPHKAFDKVYDKGRNARLSKCLLF
jgi:hypothetical protein